METSEMVNYIYVGTVAKTVKPDRDEDDALEILVAVNYDRATDSILETWEWEEYGVTTERVRYIEDFQRDVVEGYKNSQLVVNSITLLRGKQ